MESETKNTILIIGGGLIGLSIAYEFARNKFKVEVLSKNRSESAGFVAAGMLATHAEGHSLFRYFLFEKLASKLICFALCKFLVLIDVIDYRLGTCLSK